MYDNGVLKKMCIIMFIYINRLKYCLNNIDGCSYFKVILIFQKKGSLYKFIGKYCNFKV